MDDLEEIDCNEDLWNECTSFLQNGLGPFVQELRFAFQTKNTLIKEDDLDSAFWEKYPYADQIVVERVYPESKEKGFRYFAVSLIIWESGILKTRLYG